MVLTFRNTNGQTQWAKYTNLIPTPITGLTATSTVAGQIALTWAGGVGANQVYSFSVYNNTGSAAVAASAYTISGQTSTAATLTFTANTSNSYTVTVTSTVLGGSTNASATVTTLNPNIQSFTTITGNSYVVSISGLSFTTYPGGPVAVAVDMLQTKMLFSCKSGLYYSTSSDGGTTWAAFQLVSGSVTTYGAAAVTMTPDGTKGIYASGTAWSVSWTSTVPTITQLDSTSRSYWTVSLTPDGKYGVYGVLGSLIYYVSWNGSSYTWGGSLGVSCNTTVCLSPDGTKLLLARQNTSTIYYPLSWSTANPPVPTVGASVDVCTDHIDNRACVFLGGGLSGNPSYIITETATATWATGAFTTAYRFYIGSFNDASTPKQSGITLVSSIPSVNSTPIDLQCTLTPCGAKGNIIYFVENTANSGTVYNISKLTFTVT